MKNHTSIDLAVHISRQGEHFENDVQLIKWISACLNCNTNHVTAAVHKIDVKGQQAMGLLKVNQAFDNLNALLDHSGALESEILQRAVYKLRLEIARAMGDEQRATAAQQCLQEVIPAQDKVHRFLEVLQKSARVYLDDSADNGASWSVEEPTGNPGNEIVAFSWTGDNEETAGLSYLVKLTEQGIAEGRWIDDDFYCNDHEGEEVRISFYSLQRISNDLQAGLVAQSKPADDAEKEVLPGATRQEIMHLLMQDAVGEYETPDQVPEWKWVEQHACYEHIRNGQMGIWEFVINLSSSLPQVPDKLKATIREAREGGFAYLIVHQGT